MMDLDALARDVEAACYRRGGALKRPAQLRFRCPMPQRHANGDAHPSADYNPLAHVWRCTVCGASGGLVGGSDPLAPLLGIGGHTGATDPAQLAVWAAERDAAAASLAADRERKAAALAEYWAARRDVMAGEARVAVLDALLAEGIGQLAVDHFRFRADTYNGTAAVVIPWTVRGEIRAVQYRLLGDVSGGRYRWHAGSRPTLFNADAVINPDGEDTMIVVEGAKKAAAIWSVGVVGVCAVVNKGGWKPEYAPPFGAFDRVVFALDPDAWTQSVDAARTVPGARAVRLPMKPDDLLAATGGDVDVFMRYIGQAKAVGA